LIKNRDDAKAAAKQLVEAGDKKAAVIKLREMKAFDAEL